MLYTVNGKANGKKTFENECTAEGVYSITEGCNFKMPSNSKRTSEAFELFSLTKLSSNAMMVTHLMGSWEEVINM